MFVCICLDGADAQHDNDNDTLQPIEILVRKINWVHSLDINMFALNYCFLTNQDCDYEQNCMAQSPLPINQNYNKIW